MNPPLLEPARHSDPSSLHAAIARDSEAAEFLLSLLTTAAFSTRFASLLDPVPVPSRYLPQSTHQVDIARLRSDLRSLPPLRNLSQTALTATQSSLLAAAIFHPGTETLLLKSSGPDPHLPPSEQTPTRRARRFTVRATPPSVSRDNQQPPLIAFHGSPPDRWYSILRNGLRVPSAAACGVSNGRLYGDAAYLARSFALALAFAPHEHVTSLPSCSIAACSVVGEFMVHDGASAVREDVPDGYVVVPEVAGVSLTALSALVEVPASNRQVPSTYHETSSIFRLVWERVGGFGLGAALYVLALLLVGRQ